MSLGHWLILEYTQRTDYVNTKNRPALITQTMRIFFTRKLSLYSERQWSESAIKPTVPYLLNDNKSCLVKNGFTVKLYLNHATLRLENISRKQTSEMLPLNLNKLWLSWFVQKLNEKKLLNRSWNKITSLVPETRHLVRNLVRTPIWAKLNQLMKNFVYHLKQVQFTSSTRS